MEDILSIRNLKVKISSKLILNLGKEIVISEKEKVAILGDNGAVKTTFVNSILGEINYY